MSDFEFWVKHRELPPGEYYKAVIARVADEIWKRTTSTNSTNDVTRGQR